MSVVHVRWVSLSTFERERKKKRKGWVNYRLVLPLSVSVSPPPAFPFPFLPSFTGQEYLNTMQARRDRHFSSTTLLREEHVEIGGRIKVNDGPARILRQTRRLFRETITNRSDIIRSRMSRRDKWNRPRLATQTSPTLNPSNYEDNAAFLIGCNL